MKIFSKILIILVSLLLILFVANSIKSFENPLQSEHSSEISYTQSKTFEADEEHIRPLGRSVFENGVRWFSFSGSGIEFDCNATFFSVKFLSDTSLQSSNHKPRIAVFVNEESVFDETLKEDEQTVTVNLSEYNGSVKVRIIKQSESMFSSVGIEKIQIFERRQTRPTTDYSMKIEFIGDSLTAGYGIDETKKYAPFSTETENFSKTYAYLAANELDAQYSAIAFSGYGVLSGSTSNGILNSKATVFDLYDKSITNKEFENQSNQIWDCNKFKPDFVVINLGTNDATYCTTNERRELFTAEYEKLLELVREKNPDSYILCVLGDVNNSLFEYIEKAVENFKNSNDDQRISASIIKFDMGNNGAVIHGHPSEQAQRLAANELVDIIKNIIESENREIINSEKSDEQENESETNSNTPSESETGSETTTEPTDNN